MAGMQIGAVAACAVAMAHQQTGTPTTRPKAEPPKQHCSSCGAPIDMSRCDCAYCRTPLFRTPPDRWANSPWYVDSDKAYGTGAVIPQGDRVDMWYDRLTKQYMIQVDDRPAYVLPEHEVERVRGMTYEQYINLYLKRKD